MKLPLLTLLTQLCLLSSLFAAYDIAEITDLKGRSLRVKLISYTNTHLKCSKVASNNVISIPLAQLDQKSLANIQLKLVLEAEVTVLETQVSIKQRRRGKKGSYSMVKSSISASIKVKNEELDVDASECDGWIFLIGQDQKNTDQHSILLNQKFSITPGHKDTKFVSRTVQTSYDSDNKGGGNIGGYKYYAYVVFITSKDGAILSSKTTISRLNNSLDAKLLTRLQKFVADTEVTRDLEALFKI